jgi:uncharacterized protein YfaS (alpha-2-macroglobulin family)
MAWAERTYVSVLTKQQNGTYKYESVKKETVLRESPLLLPATGTNYPLPTEQPGDYALLVHDSHGTELNRIEYSVAGKGNLSLSLEKNAELQLALNKADYTPGEEIEVQIRAPYAGAGLITIERDRVFAYRWFKSDTTTTVQKIVLPATFEGNGYLSVSYIRDINSDEIFMSPLSYGVAPFSVSRERRTVKIALRTPHLAKPGEGYRIKYKTDRPTRIVLFAVDEGILQVARYNTPDPLGYFFQKRALEVTTSQILDLILPEFKRLMAIAAPGGDAGGALGGDRQQAGSLPGVHSPRRPAAAASQARRRDRSALEAADHRRSRASLRGRHRSAAWRVRSGRGARAAGGEPTTGNEAGPADRGR